MKRIILALVLLAGTLSGQDLNYKIQKKSINQKTNLWENIDKSIDSLFNIYLSKDEPIQGAVISIVTSDSIILSKGYGLSNVKTNQKFEPVKTNVMVASVSKVITATAILQLIEQGKIHLDQPVSELVRDIQIDNPFDQPVLIRHILTHTAGFDDSSIGNEAKDKEQLVSLKNHLKKRLPPIVWEPGKYYNYSNHGMVLLAHVVASVSGMSFDDYLTKNIYSPLNMSRSGFSYTIESTKNMMVRYKWKENENNELFLDDSYGIKYTNQIGAAGFQTTANDMVNFMQMYLNDGVFKGIRVLKSETIRDAFNPHFYYHSAMERKQGWTWRVRNQKGQSYNYHSGDDTGIESIISVVPEADIAFFFASNNNEANALKFKIRNLILDKIAKSKGAIKSSSPSYVSTTDLKKLVGTYQYMNDDNLQ